MSLFYKPLDGWAADVIPFFWEGEYHLFYLKDYRNHAGQGEGTPWWHLGTQDFVTFTDYGQALARGTPDEQDLYVFTGSVVYGNGQFHIFYTGHNPYFRQQGRPEQGIMHAVSPDLIHWEKVPEDTFYAPLDRYEMHDWRDPFVFWNQESGEWWMLLAARLKDGPSRRRGCTALCTSTDLRDWRVREPLYAPRLYYTHECPDMFKIGDWWYLLFSEFSQACVTRYRISQTPHGSWQAPANDTFDGRAFYAAKTASDGDRRFIFGWNPTREGEKDTGNWQWGGNIVAHQILQDRDGMLSVQAPATVVDTLHTPLPLEFSTGIGDFSYDRNRLALRASNSFVGASAGKLPEICKIQGRLTFTAETRDFGVFLRMDDAFEKGYYLRFEPGYKRLVFDFWPRAGDAPYMIGLERPINLQPGRPVSLIVFVDGVILEAYVNEVIALSARMYEHREGNWGFYSSEGHLTVDGVSVHI